MKYIVMMQFKVKGWGDGNISKWSEDEIQKNREYLERLNLELSEKGELVSTNGLGGPESMRIVTARKGADAIVSDGPFPESKEFLAGYWIIDVESADRAYQIAAQISAIPGPGGAPSYLPIEVRPVLYMSNAEG